MVVTGERAGKLARVTRDGSWPTGCAPSPGRHEFPRYPASSVSEAAERGVARLRASLVPPLSRRRRRRRVRKTSHPPPSSTRYCPRNASVPVRSLHGRKRRTSRSARRSFPESGPLAGARRPVEAQHVWARGVIFTLIFRTRLSTVHVASSHYTVRGITVIVGNRKIEDCIRLREYKLVKACIKRWYKI